MYLNPFSIPPFITAILILIIGLLVYSRKNTKLNKIFFCFCLSLVLWLFPYSLMYSSRNYELALIFARCGFTSIIFIPILAYHFIITLLNKENKIVLRIAYLSAVPSIYLGWTDQIYRGLKEYFWGFYPLAGKLYVLFMIEFFILFSYGLLLLFMAFTRNKEKYDLMKLNQVIYVFWAFLFGTTGIVDYVVKYELPIAIYPFGYLSALYFIVLIAYAIVKYRLMDIRLVITKITVFFFVYGLVLGVPVFIGIKYKAWHVSTFLMLFLATMGPYIYGFLRKKAERRLFYDQIMYQKTLTDFSKNTVEIKDLSDLIHSAVDTIYKSIGLSHVLFYLFDKNLDFYDLKYYMSSIDCGFVLNFEKTSKLMEFLKSNKTVILTQEVHENQDIRALLEKQEIDLTIPLIYDKQFLGAIFLGSKKNKTLYTDQDIIVLKILANQISLAIENCIYLKELQQKISDDNATIRRNKLDGATATIAHQIDNPNAIVFGNLEFLKMDLLPLISFEQDSHKKDFIDALDSSLDASKRITKIIRDIENFARGGKDLGPVNIYEEVLAPFETILKPIQREFSGIEYSQQIDSDLRKIWAEPVYLQEILQILVENAHHAVSKKEINRKVILKVFNTGYDTVKFEVIDSGYGITKDKVVRGKLFETMHTSKGSSEMGSGIGLVRVRSICQKIKADFGFESDGVDCGAKFWIDVPICQ